eukprot:11423897-Ditylum_brightwellii.AAC.1
MMVHMYRQPLHIPHSGKPDQLCHAVIRPRTMQQMKARSYSNSFSIFEQKGTFLGIDTCSVTNLGDFSFCSKLLHDAETRSLKNRPDMNIILLQLAKENVM